MSVLRTVQLKHDTAGRGIASPQYMRVQRLFSLLWALVYRNVMARYRKSVLGIGWAIVQPVMYMVVFTLLRGVSGVNSDGIPYPLFTFAALAPWSFFSNAIVTSAPSVVMNANVVKKVAVPREVFPLSAVITALFDFVMASLVLAGLMIFYKVAVGWALLWMPVLLGLTTMLAFAIGMLLAAFGTFKHDLVLAAPFLMQLWLFASPIIYPFSQVPEQWRTLYMLNPMAGLIEGYRNILLRAEAPALDLLAWSTVITFVVLAVTWPLFRWISQYFADVV